MHICHKNAPRDKTRLDCTRLDCICQFCKLMRFRTMSGTRRTDRIELDGMKSEIVADGDVKEVAADVAAQVDFVGAGFDD